MFVIRLLFPSSSLFPELNVKIGEGRRKTILRKGVKSDFGIFWWLFKVLVVQNMLMYLFTQLILNLG